MRRCLVTGATGLIGSSLVAALQPDWDVIGISRGRQEEDPRLEGASHLAIDFSQAWDTAAFPGEIDAVIHLAQSEHFRDFPERPWTSFR